MFTGFTAKTGILLAIFLFAGCVPVTPVTTVAEHTVVPENLVTVEVTRIVETTPTPDSNASAVTVADTEQITLHASASDRDYNIFVALPRYYYTRKVSYPVIYVLDGDLFMIWAALYSRGLSANEIIPETIIVGIDNSHQRSQDLLPKNQEGVDNFLTFLNTDLIPYVNETYRTKPEENTLAGFSYSSLFALYTLFHSPETFSRYIVTTPPISLEDVIYEYEEAYASEHADLPVNLFLSVGGRENFADQVSLLYQRLTNRNYDSLEANMVVLENHGHTRTLYQGFIEGLNIVFQ